MNSKLIRVALLAFSLAGGSLGATAQHKYHHQANAITESPWGVAAHPLRPVEWESIGKVKALCREAGIRWMRTDFSFSYICQSPDTLYFDKYDQLLEQLQQGGMQVLPILQGYDWEIKNKRPQAWPLYQHPEEWRRYVRATVQRYHHRLKYWEIWNEQDGGFWKPKPDAAQYVALLKIAYEEIKAIDPTCQVVIGGLVSWNAPYLQDMYKAGAKGYFDILAVHPYQWGPDASAKTLREMEAFQSVMQAHQQGHLPVWITEGGSSTFTGALTLQQPDFMIQAIRYALTKIAKTPAAALTIGVAMSPRVKNLEEEAGSRPWLPGIKLKSIAFDNLATLDPQQCPVLIGTEGLNIDAPMLEPLKDYVKRGGLLLAVNKLPFFTVHTQGADGIWRAADQPEKTYPFFHMGFEAFWTKPGIPVSTHHVQLAPAALAAGLPPVKDIYMDRFLSAKNMAPGDHYYPIIQAFDKDGRLAGEAMALYTSKDWKGGILASTASVESGVTETVQANLLQRVYLTYLAAGIQKIFWYDLHNDGTMKGEREHNFGLMHYDWMPKPAWHAYKAMTAALGDHPAFVKRISGKDNQVWALVFKRKEDGKHVLAIWSVDEQTNFRLNHKKKDKPVMTGTGTQVHFIPLEYRIKDYTIQ